MVLYLRAADPNGYAIPDVWACKTRYIRQIDPHLLICLKSGDSPTILLTEPDKPPTELRDRWKVVEKMLMVTQYAFSGDYTGWFTYRCIVSTPEQYLVVKAIEKGVLEVAKYDAGKLICTKYTFVILSKVVQMTGL